MAQSEHCLKEGDWGELRVKLETYDKHVDESEKKDGYRDRLIKTELVVLNVQKAQTLFFVYAAVGGFIGGLLGKAAPVFLEEAVKFFARKPL